MKIVVDYEEEKKSPSYWNNVMAATECCKEKFFIKEVHFVNFPLSELTDIHNLVKEASARKSEAPTGVLMHKAGVLIFKDDKEPFRFECK